MAKAIDIRIWIWISEDDSSSYIYDVIAKSIALKDDLPLYSWLLVGSFLLVPAATVIGLIVHGIRMGSKQRARVNTDLERVSNSRNLPKPGGLPAPVRAEYTTHRPTATRTAGGFLLGGPVGALIGFAWRKKERQKIEVR